MTRMNGQLSEQPLVELIREISAKSLGGRLHLEHDRVKVVAYFDSGNFVYAASNLRTLRLREYLLKSNLVSEQDLTQFNDRVSDTDLVKVLCAQKLLDSICGGTGSSQTSLGHPSSRTLMDRGHLGSRFEISSQRRIKRQDRRELVAARCRSQIAGEVCRVAVSQSC